MGQEKVERLLQYGARVHVISADVTDEVRALAEGGEIEWTQRKYQRGDLEGALIAIAADTSNGAMNEAVYDEAKARNVPLNVADVTHLCTWITPAVVRRGDVIVAASTGGASPALARRFREELSGTNRVRSELGVMEFADLVPLLSDVRTVLLDKGIRINTDHWQVSLTDDLVQMVQTDQYEAARDELLHRLMEGTTCGCPDGTCRQWEELTVSVNAKEPAPSTT